MRKNQSNVSATDDDVKRIRRGAYIKMAAMAGIVVAVLAFSSIAWFTMNREVEGTGAQMVGDKLPFELEVRGTKVEQNAYFSMADGEYKNGVQQEDEEGNAVEIYQTSGNPSKLIWRKAADADGTYADGLEPGAHGTLTFWVVPKQDDIDVKFTMSIRGFSAVFDDEDPTKVNDLIEITPQLQPTPENGLTDEKIAAKQRALKYVQGHILFFQDYQNGYYYDFCGTERSAVLSYYSDTVKKGEPVKVTLYWKWANTLEQMILDENAKDKDNPLFKSTNTTDRTAIYTYLKNTSKNYVFKGLSESIITTSLTNLENADDRNIRNLLTNAYNDADQDIGNYLDFILIELNAE